jgi:hypothetical protein
MPEFEFLLDPKDKHWVRLDDPRGCARDIGNWWESNCIGKGTRPTIVIRIPEILGSKNPKITIRWYSNDWHYIGIDKSKDGVTWEKVWGRADHYKFDETHTIDLDPTCQYYRIHFADGNLKHEVTRVFKRCKVSYEEGCICDIINQIFDSPDEVINFGHVKKAHDLGAEACAIYLFDHVGARIGALLPECFEILPPPSETKGTVTIATIPNGADVYIDGEYKGKT